MAWAGLPTAFIRSHTTPAPDNLALSTGLNCHSSSVFRTLFGQSMFDPLCKIIATILPHGPANHGCYCNEELIVAMGLGFIPGVLTDDNSPSGWDLLGRACPHSISGKFSINA